MTSEAVLLVGGKGTRLRPLTMSAPKPMLPVAGVPFITHQLARAREAGVEHAILSTSYRAEVFEEHFGDGASLGMLVEYVTEEEPLGTGGGIRNVADRLTGDGPVLVFNGDVLSGVDLRAVVADHERTGAAVTIYLTRVADPRAFGLVPTDPDGRVLAFLEKPQTEAEIVTDQINAGCYVFGREALLGIPAGRKVSVERETFPALLAAGQRIQGHLDDSYWLDLGTPAAFVTGSCDLVQGRAPSPAVPGRPGPALVLPGAHVAETATVTGGTCVGAGAVVAAGATVDGSVLFDGSVIEEGAVVRGSVVGVGARVGRGSVVADAVLGDRVVVGAGNELLAGVRVWPGTELADVSVRFSSDAT